MKASNRAKPNGQGGQRYSPPDLQKLKHVDQHVENTPPKATESLESLASYLGSVAKTELEKVRAVYRWITTNIAYDAEGLLDPSRKMPNRAELVLKNRVCVCEGYSRLMVTLCDQVNVECKYLFGYSRDWKFNPLEADQATFKPEHAWNAVKVDGKWGLIDATWGAGSSSDGTFIRNPNDDYFLSDPAWFIQTHLPATDSVEGSKGDQLLEPPIDLTTFRNLAIQSPDCISIQVEPVSHKQAVIDVTDEVTLRFKGTGKPLTLFSGVFKDPKTGANLTDSNRYVAVVLDRRTNEVTVTARPPTSGVCWKLMVFGTANPIKAASLSGTAFSSPLLMAYYIRASAKYTLPRFPDYTGFYGLWRNPEKCGLSSDLGPYWIKAKGGELELKLPVSRSVPKTAGFEGQTSADGAPRFVFVEAGDGYMKVSLRMHRAGFHSLQLYCKDLYASDKFLSHMATFLIECKFPMKLPRPFPVFTPFALQERATLVSPRDGDLPARSNVKIVIHSATLCQLLVRGEPHFKSAGGEFRVEVGNTGASGSRIEVSGSTDAQAGSESHYYPLYTFNVV